jgi:fatty acid omega-hydroxylase
VKEHYDTVEEFITDLLKRDDLDDKKKGMISDVEDHRRDKSDLISLFIQQSEEELSRDELRDIAMNFIIAGRDTTAILVTFALYCLCKYPDALTELLKREVDPYDSVTYRNAAKLKYMEGVLCETLRLFPPVPVLTKECMEDIVIPTKVAPYLNEDGVPSDIDATFGSVDDADVGYIRKGEILSHNAMIAGRAPYVWENPLDFNPLRWTSGVSTFDQYRFPAFNVAPRGCLGKHFAMMEAKVVLFDLLKHFDFDLVRAPERDDSQLKYALAPTLQVDDMNMRVRKREVTVADGP